jgi:hypothetical protein
MKSISLFIIAFFISFVGFSQLLSGDLLESNRYLLKPVDFNIKSNIEGVVYYELSVNELGKVTSQRFLSENSTLKSTMSKMDAVNYIKKFEFLGGSLFPKFQYVVVQINFVKE